MRTEREAFDVWCMGLYRGNQQDIAWAAWQARAARAAPAQPAEPEAWPVGWFESPHGKFRANHLCRMEWPASTLKWQIPVYLAAPAQPASQSERWNIERDGTDLLVCFNAHDKSEKCE